MKKLVTVIFLKKKGEFALFFNDEMRMHTKQFQILQQYPMQTFDISFLFFFIMKVSYFINEDACIDKFRMQHLIEMAYYFPPYVFISQFNGNTNTR